MNFSVKDKVIKLLTEYPHLREDDNKLIANIWHQECKGNNVLQLYAENKLTNAESIRRSRQKIQQENPHLRGALWNKRHKHQEKVKNDLNNLDWMVPGKDENKMDKNGQINFL